MNKTDERRHTCLGEEERAAYKKKIANLQRRVDDLIAHDECHWAFRAKGLERAVDYLVLELHTYLPPKKEPKLPTTGPREITGCMGKFRYMDEESTRVEIERIKKTNAYKTKPSRTIEAYQCSRCTYWHIGGRGELVSHA